MKVIATGIDIVEIDRIRKILRRHGEAFESYVLTRKERDACPAGDGPRARVIAMLWAAKEALLKITGAGIWGPVQFNEMEIEFDNDGFPIAALNEKIRRLLRSKAGSDNFRLHLSIASSKVIACAAALLISNGGEKSEKCK